MDGGWVTGSEGGETTSDSLGSPPNLALAPVTRSRSSIFLSFHIVISCLVFLSRDGMGIYCEWKGVGSVGLDCGDPAKMWATWSRGPENTD